MEDIKSTIAKNISELRLQKGLTQLELAQMLHYSDKAVSKWERAESVPEISTLVAVADLFGVPLDYLARDEHGANEQEPLIPQPDDEPEEPETLLDERKVKNHAIITSMSILLVWFIALFIYVLIDVIFKNAHGHWLTFIYAAPISMLLWLIFNSIWFNRRRNYLIISLLVWTLLAALHITFLICKINIWQIYLLGLPGQLVIFLWSRLNHVKSNT
ncbi:MAG: helix-turn-helix transcriptional regulator [Oscillospiraceae bacterium]|nr:helix-turn-helix transcriptional regulator [Oscillospiraceae bacterium]